ncbi:MAG: Pol4 [Nitrospira sp.]|jgi:DNA polymerase (family 10)|nr:Pol4 [Nitrospira sp.]
MTKHDVARVLKDIAFFLFLRGDNPYKAQAYERAGLALLTSPADLHALIATGSLTDLPGIGPATARAITELVTTGHSTVHEQARGEYPSSLVALDDVPGLTRKQILKLYEQAGITSVADLKVACRNGRLLAVPGMGPKLQAKLLDALGEYERGQGYSLYADVVEEAHALETALRALPRIDQAVLCGAMRRKMEVINELVFVLTYDDPASSAGISKHVRTIPNLSEVAVEDETIRARSPMGMPVRIVITPSRNFGFSLLQETGSSEHLDQLLGRFRERGFTKWTAVQAKFRDASEEALYQAVSLPYIAPELREGRGELEWASHGRKPTFLEPRAIKGVFHLHTVYSDGAGTVEEMVSAARNRGFRYLGISDHSQSAFYANGLKEPRIRAQWDEINAVQKKYRDIHLFKGIEADILPDGSIDYPDELLAEFDFVIASVHSRFNLPEKEQTARICKALSHPSVTMLGHPTGRLLLGRRGYRLDLDQVIAAAARHHKLLEINGSRHRLDLDWRWARVAKAHGVKFCINPDAHAVDEFENVAWGVNVAQKAGLDADDVINTKSLTAIKSFLRQARHAD